jgi:hypothetical protein
MVIFSLCLSSPGCKLQTSEHGIHIEPVFGQVEWVDIFGVMNADLRVAR